MWSPYFAFNLRFMFLKTEYSELVHYLGGSVRKDYSDQVTHVISHANLGEKYLVSISKLNSNKWECWTGRKSKERLNVRRQHLIWNEVKSWLKNGWCAVGMNEIIENSTHSSKNSFENIERSHYTICIYYFSASITI